MMSQSRYVTLLLLFSVGFSHAQQTISSENPPRTISVEQAQRLAKRVLLIDLRTPQEFSEKTFGVKNSINIPIEDFESQLSRIPKDQSIVLACRTGNKSKKAYAILEKNGYANMFHVDGGFVAWSEAGLATKEGNKTRNRPKKKNPKDNQAIFRP